jgi:hypothetical protein
LVSKIQNHHCFSHIHDLSLPIVVVHGLLEPVSGGYRFDNQPNICPNLQAVVYSLPDLLKTPLKNLTWDPRFFAF